MLTTLTLRHSPGAVRPAVAWFLAGDDPAVWLEEIRDWPVALETIDFYLCPAERESGRGRMAGALVVPPVPIALPAGARALAFGQLAPGIFAPVDAEVWPPVTADELRRASPYPVLIFHPVLGLTGAETTDRRRAWDFVFAPPAVAAAWNVAVAGAPPLPGLRGVQLATALSLDDIFGQESNDIGSEPLDILPPAPREPTDNVTDKLARGASELLAKTLMGITSMLPQTAKGPTWANSLQDWARRQLTSISRELDQVRHRELHRLAELLKNNPEEGLRHAIPLSGLAHRGTSAPSSRLGRRSLDFSLGRLRGGQAADFWDVPEQLRASLAMHYRELAVREMKLGRHRRAACIFAELLGDFSAAADALRQGRFFQEAAVLYRDRLRNPLAAAGCLAEGGSFAEALALYEEHERWLEAADLHARLGDKAAEHAAVRKVVDAHLEKSDVVSAARLIDTRLGLPDEALSILAHAWPHGKQALASIEERFALLERHHRSEEACKLAVALGEEATPGAVTVPLTGLLASTFEKSVDARLRHAAANSVRLKVATALAGGRRHEGETSLLRALTRIAPGDRLLVRDVQHFRSLRERPAPRATAPSADSSLVRRIALTKREETLLDRAGRWTRALGDSSGFFAVAYTADRKILYTRSNWSGVKYQLGWTDPAPDRSGLFILQAYVTSVVLARPFAARLPLKPIPLVDALGGITSEVGTPMYLPEDAVEVTSSRFTLWVARAVSDRVVLDAFENQALVSSTDVTDALTAAGATGGGTKLTLAAQIGSTVALGYGQHVLVKSQGTLRVSSTLGGRVLGLMAVQGPGLPAGWVALLERGAAFLSLDGNVHFSIDDSLVTPRGCFLADGRLILVGPEEGLVIRLELQRAVRLAWFPFSGEPCIAISITNEPDTFAGFAESGVVRRWQIPV